MTVQQHWKKWQAKIFSAKNRPNLLFSLLIIGLVLGVVLAQAKSMQKQGFLRKKQLLNLILTLMP